MQNSEVKKEAQKEVRKDDFFHKKLIVRMVLVVVLAVLAFVATFAIESISERRSFSVASEFSYKNSRLNIPSYAYFNSENGDVSEVLTVLENDDDKYVFEMSEGRVFGNFMNSTTKINVRVADKIVIIPDFSMFEAKYDEDEGSLYLANFGGNTYIGFLPEDVEVSGYIDEYDGMLNNVLFIPAGMRTRIYLSRADGCCR